MKRFWQMSLIVALAAIWAFSYRTPEVLITALPAAVKPKAKTDRALASEPLATPKRSQLRNQTVQLPVETEELPATLMGNPGWYVVRDLRAIERSRFQQQGEWVEDWGPISLYRLANPQQTSANPSEMRVVYRPDRRRMAVLMGRVTVQLKDINQAAAVLSEYGLKAEIQKDEIRYVIARPVNGQDVVKVAERLASDPRVDNARLEVASRDLETK